jgi:DNA-binding NtrC family response regulator
MTLSILLVEDEAMIRMMIADMVEELGHRVAAEAGDMRRATELARTASFDLAILDVNLQGAMSHPVAEALTARQIPYIVASGYGSNVTSAQYGQQLVLQKPFTIDALESAIHRTMQREGK